MRKWSRYVVGVVAITGWLALVISAGAETCKLEAKRLDGAGDSTLGNFPVAYWFQSTRPQSSFMQIGGPQGMVRGAEQPGLPEFSKVITKELSAYNAEQPFRGVVQLGSQHFGFVFDTAAKAEAKEGEKPEQPKKDEAKSDTQAETAANPLLQILGSQKQVPTVAFQRLYFDVNHNGDLTDDAVVEAAASQNMSVNYVHCTFPAVSVKIEVEGVPIEYAFTMAVYSYASADYSYANASLSAAAYREGEMVIDGKKRRVVVVDSNSNGRYDDPSGINKQVQVADGSVYPEMGDTLFVIDPEVSLDSGSHPYDPTTNSIQHFVGKQVNVEGRFLDLKITPAGDQVTLEPSAIPVGQVANPNKGYRAIVYGESGLLKVVGDESGKAPLPVGEWHLLSYTLNKTVTEEPAADDAEAKKPEGSLLDAVRQLIGGGASAASQQSINMVSARGTKDSPVIEVKEGQTVDMKFGEPYRPVVLVSYGEGADRVALSMQLVGSGGEVCSNMVVNGGRPGKPKFTISTEKGEVVETGNFEYG